MILNYLCPPALIYVVFFLIQIIIELGNNKNKHCTQCPRTYNPNYYLHYFYMYITNFM